MTCRPSLCHRIEAGAFWSRHARATLHADQSSCFPQTPSLAPASPAYPVTGIRSSTPCPAPHSEVRHSHLRGLTKPCRSTRSRPREPQRHWVPRPPWYTLRMERPSPGIDAERLRTAFELLEAGLEIKRASLRRDRPGLTRHDENILLRKWLVDKRWPLQGVEGFQLRGKDQ